LGLEEILVRKIDSSQFQTIGQSRFGHFGHWRALGHG